MKTKLWAMGLIVLCTVFTTAAQYFWKLATDGFVLDISVLLTNYWLWLGFFFYGVAAFLLIIALKGGELSVLYPIIATSFIWVTILSNIAFGESLGMNKLLGIGTIMIGITFIGVGSK